MHPVLIDLQRRYPDITDCMESIQAAYTPLRDAYHGGGKVLICGNGGSSADSDHIVGELMKGFELKRPVSDEMRQRLQQVNPEVGAYLADRLQGALPTISLSGHAALMTAISNDVAADMVFAQQVYGYGKPGDVVIAISTSGNAPNILHALHVAKALELRTIGLTGQSGGAMRALCDVCICIPDERTATIQERHLPVYHALCLMLEQEFFG